MSRESRLEAMLWVKAKGLQIDTKRLHVEFLGNSGRPTEEATFSNLLTCQQWVKTKV